MVRFCSCSRAKAVSTSCSTQIAGDGVPGLAQRLPLKCRGYLTARSAHPEQGLNQQINGDARVAGLLLAYFVALRSSGFALRAGILDNLIRW